MAIPNYVKFQRGSATSYEHLAHKDDNTLYFIYNDNDQTKGSLYLGTRLISNSVGGNSTVSLADLTDTLINSVNTGDFLVVNSDGKWVPVSAAEVAQIIIEANGNFISVDENEFSFNSVNGKLELKNYSSATIGMVPVKTNNGLNWTELPPDLSTTVGTLSGQISSLETAMQAIDGKIANAIANSNHLTYKAISDLAEAIDENVIYLYDNNTNENSNIYDEYMLIDGQLEKIGSLNINLDNYVTTLDLTTSINNLSETLGNRIEGLETTINNLDNTYVTKTTFNSVVGNLSDLNNYNNLDYANGASIKDTFIDIYERLVWQDISE